MSSDYQRQRQLLIDSLRKYGISEEKVLAAMQKVPRELFVDPIFKEQAYIDYALPIEESQTISQPFIVALMTESLLKNRKMQKVLEIGTGSGYQAAILAQLVPEVYTIERIELLHQQSKLRFQQLHYENIYCKYADGISGWPEKSPFDGIIVTAATTEIPQTLLTQLAEDGRLLLPLGEVVSQELVLITRKGNRFIEQSIENVAFVPLLSGTKPQGSAI